METIEVKDISSFIENTEFSGGFNSSSLVLYRGQKNKGNLLPSIARIDPTKNTIKDELKLIDQLKLMGASFINGQDQNDWDLLVLAQHFGLKTRILDWTSNPLAAMWFACTDKLDGDVYVYSLVADTLLSKNTYNSSIFKQSKTIAFQPKFNNQRIIAQHGYFTAHRYSKSSNKFVSLENNQKVKNHLVEYCIPGTSRETMIESLDLYGVNSKTLFPDLEGLCKYLNWKHKLT